MQPQVRTELNALTSAIELLIEQMGDIIERIDVIEEKLEKLDVSHEH